MIITLPDDPVLVEMGEDEIRVDLACGAFAAGHVSRDVAARMAGMDRLTFDAMLFERGIPSFDDATFDEDMDTLRSLGRL